MMGKKILYAATGLIATSLAIIGVWVPVMPTTVFVLIALWAFSNSSARLHGWFVKIPVLKHAIREAERYRSEGTIDPRVKIISQTCSWVSFAAITLLVQKPAYIIIAGLLATSCTAFMIMTPSASRLAQRR